MSSYFLLLLFTLFIIDTISVPLISFLLYASYSLLNASICSAILFLTSINKLYSNSTNFSSAPKISSSNFFSSSVIYLSPVDNVCFLV